MTKKRECGYLIKEKELLEKEVDLIFQMLEYRKVKLNKDQRCAAKMRVVELQDDLEVLEALIEQHACLQEEIMVERKQLLKEVRKEIYN